MSAELVTGYSGVDSSGEPNRHVSSAEDGARQAGTLGLGCYVLSTGSKLSASMEDANTLVVADGDAMINGRHVSLPDPTSFTIPTGVQGQKVSNLAVLRYEVGADSVESVTPVVITGEPSAESPADPAHNDGSILEGASTVDFPLYRVVTDGINAGDPEPLFDVLMPMADLWDSVSQSDWTDVWSGSSNQYVRYSMVGRLVTIVWSFNFDRLTQWQTSGLPEDARPEFAVYSAAALQSQNNAVSGSTAMATVYPDGTISFRSSTAVSGVWHEGLVTYPAKG